MFKTLFLILLAASAVSATNLAVNTDISQVCDGDTNTSATLTLAEANIDFTGNNISGAWTASCKSISIDFSFSGSFTIDFTGLGAKLFDTTPVASLSGISLTIAGSEDGIDALFGQTSATAIFTKVATLTIDLSNADTAATNIIAFITGGTSLTTVSLTYTATLTDRADLAYAVNVKNHSSTLDVTWDAGDLGAANSGCEKTDLDTDTKWQAGVDICLNTDLLVASCTDSTADDDLGGSFLTIDSSSVDNFGSTNTCIAALDNIVVLKLDVSGLTLVSAGDATDTLTLTGLSVTVKKLILDTSGTNFNASALEALATSIKGLSSLTDFEWIQAATSTDAIAGLNYDKLIAAITPLGAKGKLTVWNPLISPGTAATCVLLGTSTDYATTCAGITPSTSTDAITLTQSAEAKNLYHNCVSATVTPSLNASATWTGANIFGFSTTGYTATFSNSPVSLVGGAIPISAVSAL